MSATDLYLRSKPKAQVTDLWLHPAGAEGGAPPTLSDSGTVTSSAVLTGAQQLVELDVVAPTGAGMPSSEWPLLPIWDEGTVVSVAWLGGEGALVGALPLPPRGWKVELEFPSEMAPRLLRADPAVERRDDDEAAVALLLALTD